MVAEFKSLTGFGIFCGIVAKMAIYNRASIYRAFSAYLWRLVILAGSYAQASIGIYRPASSSATINVAVGDYANDDLDGQPRNKPDIGADKVSSNAVRRRPLTPRDVGPSWMNSAQR